MTSTALVAGLLPFLKAIGRWIVERLVEKGIEWLLAVMDDRIDAFERRRKRVRSPMRKRILRRRIARWKKAMRWLKNHSAATIRGEMREAYRQCLLIARAEGIPMVSPKERA